MVSAKDIAERLGISTSAVSIAMNNKPGISEATRKLVLDTAAEMGYSRRTKTGAVGALLQLLVCTPSPTMLPFNRGLFMDTIVEGIGLQSQKYDYTLSVSYVSGEDLRSEDSGSLIHSDCMGVIFLSAASEPLNMEFLSSISVPVVVIDRPAELFGIDCVVLDNAQGIKTAIAYLRDLGHRRIAFLGENIEYSDYSERMLSYLNAVSGYDDMLDSARNIFLLDASSSSSADRSAEIDKVVRSLTINGNLYVSAFVCSNDWLAAGCVKALNANGFNVPSDVSVVGFENQAVSEITSPSLTTVDIPKQRLGAAAVERLHQKICGFATAPSKVELLTELIVRGSTGTAAN